MEKGKEKVELTTEGEKLQEFLKFQYARKLTKLARTFLNLLEEIKAADQSFDFNTYRKQVLDQSNDAIRELDELFNKVNFTLK
jgi:hypothetical protein